MRDREKQGINYNIIAQIIQKENKKQFKIVKIKKDGNIKEKNRKKNKKYQEGTRETKQGP